MAFFCPLTTLKGNLLQYRFPTYYEEQNKVILEGCRRLKAVLTLYLGIELFHTKMMSFLVKTAHVDILKLISNGAAQALRHLPSYGRAELSII